MQPILWLCRLALWMVTATAFVLFSFYGLASCSRKHVSVPPTPPSAEEVAKVDAVRELHPDFASAPRVAIDVDYAEGADARWWPRGEALVLKNLVADGLLPPVAERVGAQPLVLHGAEGIGAYG